MGGDRPHHPLKNIQIQSIDIYHTINTNQLYYIHKKTRQIFYINFLLRN
jgi:hypothetical protein